MITVPPDLQVGFQALLARKNIPEKYRSHYSRWLRYYWDFCHKYDYPVSSNHSLVPFIGKLREKQQAAFQIEQAADAIGTYYELAGGAKGAPGAGRGTAEGESLAGAPQKAISKSCPSVGKTVDGAGVTPRPGATYDPPASGRLAVHAPAVRAYGTGTDGVRQPGGDHQFTERAGAEKGERRKTGANWQSAFDALDAEIKLRHYSRKTLKSYSGWLGQFQAFTRSKPLDSLSDTDIKGFLTYLAVQRNVAAATQNLAFNALLFFYRHVLKKEPGDLKNIARAKRKPYIPVVLARHEIDQIISQLAPPLDLVVMLLYGCGLRLFECLNLRLNNFNLDALILTVHDGKGKKDRTVPMPETALSRIRGQMEYVRALHGQDLKAGYDGAFMFGSIEKKFKNAAKELAWQWFFPGFSMTHVPQTGEKRRYHIHERHVQKAIKAAVRDAGLFKRVTSHSFRHSYATHLLQANYDIRTIQDLLGHSDIRTTMIYTHTIKSRTFKETKSPLDFQLSE
ncbi:integron integrase [Desulfatitalea alkaliphila]|uniref:Integron integrase n=1 Tax=Desulfatitalea alkaliphila TaxID=2929485 RepID=A0AA41R5D2_9BACT|nr:integron integrase [Desulfatitalea alkaliphila]MCJ8502629.1 integron integrase [Desulfatitalea alkaliphila]